MKSIRSNYAIRMWPKQAVEFLEKRIQFMMPPQRNVALSLMDRGDATGAPTKVVAATNNANSLMYMCEYENNTRKLIEAKAADPVIVLKFLETHLENNAELQSPGIAGIKGMLLH